MAFVEVQNLSKNYLIKTGAFSTRTLVAVNGVSFEIEKGKTLGLVGESGCGKSTLGRTLLRLIDRTGGDILFDGISVGDLGRSALMVLRRRMQMIFQDPYSSLNPRMSVADIISEPLVIHRLCRDRKAVSEEVKRILSLVGLPEDALYRYPHEFSGGQRQRIGIARALAVQPEFIVCDEPVSALDVSIQAQIVNLLTELQRKFGLTYLFISHDLRVVHHTSDDVAVMYLGKIVEKGPRDLIYSDPRHPYTRSLLSSVPNIHGTRSERVPLKGEPPTPLDPPTGCAFHPRCPIAVESCRKNTPALRELPAGSGRTVACDIV